MRSVSNAFKEVINAGGPFYAWTRIVLKDGTELELNSQNDFYISGNKYDHSFSAAFPFGEAVCKMVDLGIDNIDERFSVHDFDGAQITLYTEIGDLNSPERLQEGIFTVIDSNLNGDIIELSAADNMYKTDTAMPTVSYPATLSSIVSAICTKCGIVLADASFTKRNYHVILKPKEMTCREMLGYVAQLVGGNALIDYTGKLIFKEYAQFQNRTHGIISGSVLNESSIDELISGDEFISGSSDTIDGDTFDSTQPYIILSNYVVDPKIGTDDITITGVSYTYTENNVSHTELVGNDGYVLKINNPLIDGNVSTGLGIIGGYLIGLRMRPFSGTFPPNPTIELMDTVIVVDRKGNSYESFVSSHTFTYLGNSDIANETKSNAENNASYISNANQVYHQLQKDLQDDRSAWGNAVDQLELDLANASGLFQTTEQQPDQSYIYYFHDKSTLIESQNIIKITSQAIAISTDGGQTYPVGVTVDGNAIVSILSAIGINADWINAGTLSVGGSSSTSGKIAIYDSSDDIIGTIDDDGVQLYGTPLKILDSSGINNSTTTGPNVIKLYTKSNNVTHYFRITSLSGKFMIDHSTNDGTYSTCLSVDTSSGNRIFEIGTNELYAYPGGVRLGRAGTPYANLQYFNIPPYNNVFTYGGQALYSGNFLYKKPDNTSGQIFVSNGLITKVT